ncbi:endoribonuclease Dicer homolog 4-like isoform X1 [Dioscorea cayenensis subsp. rotundata]|uniref:Endoribonuclease Dicer homolog 4-like isoform X1 n=1 Tax=Dioscorea cayennensis subsp. rotundata TaxID=55577 RepID=A0AB40BY61_DIOCR|nr:endoribonuclease Dicer homolog 4-like isoform X1 [Dioscorea cayenensis subsp. rotundata]XP_039131651.1 endoribonuclease Dicer homolog 4-like isoform X1 [Dioscorea cayenensis subsp. rotundata]XP_039131652.1 endoribonuclease Dicer homolog 4-like isoform X1 [Dioscorea cayenensis subsp. rotundata]XP_039131653.1 endoribonuclease Dicer homolog 4-like isoform X1 [Dioscorea cayenensis subsp. rotundata]
MEGSSRSPLKDPRKIARNYQLEVCKKAVDQNLIVFLRTGGGKTHIAVLLMYELRNEILKPSRSICVFLAPTGALVKQQALVIESSTNFKVSSYFGKCKRLKDHAEWDKEIDQFEVLVMTPQILLHSLQHCFIRMEHIVLLIFDECHHAQAQSRHPYAQIMKEFYKTNTPKVPRIFGMTASPIVGKGGLNQLEYSRRINSLENLLEAKICSVDHNLQLECVAATPDIKIYLYGPVANHSSGFIVTCTQKLEETKDECTRTIRKEQCDDFQELQKQIKTLERIHGNLVFCLENIGLQGASYVAKILLSSDHNDLMQMELDNSDKVGCIADHYLKMLVQS